MMDTTSFIVSLLCVAIGTVSFAMECDMSVDRRFDCYPEDGASQQKCEARGCCWQVPSKDTYVGVPYCFYPTDYDMYQISGPVDTEFGCTANLTRSQPSYYPNTIKNLQLDIYYETQTRLHFKVSALFPFKELYLLLRDLYLQSLHFPVDGIWCNMSHEKRC